MGCGANGKAIEAHRALLKQAEQNADDLRCCVEEQRKESRRFEGERNQVSHELDEALSQLRTVRRQLDDAEAKLAVETGNGRRAEESWEKIKSESQILRDELKAATVTSKTEDCEAIEKLRMDLRERDTIISELRTQNSQLSAECDSLVSEQAGQNVRLQDLAAKNRALQKEFMAVQTEALLARSEASAFAEATTSRTSELFAATSSSSRERRTTSTMPSSAGAKAAVPKARQPRSPIQIERASSSTSKGEPTPLAREPRSRSSTPTANLCSELPQPTLRPSINGGAPVEVSLQNRAATASPRIPVPPTHSPRTTASASKARSLSATPLRPPPASTASPRTSTTAPSTPVRSPRIASSALTVTKGRTSLAARAKEAGESRRNSRSKPLRLPKAKASAAQAKSQAPVESGQKNCPVAPWDEHISSSDGDNNTSLDKSLRSTGVETFSTPGRRGSGDATADRGRRPSLPKPPTATIQAASSGQTTPPRHASASGKPLRAPWDEPEDDSEGSDAPEAIPEHSQKVPPLQERVVTPSRPSVSPRSSVHSAGVSAAAAASSNQVQTAPAPHEDPSAKVFSFDFSVFDFLQHEALQSPRSKGGPAAMENAFPAFPATVHTEANVQEFPPLKLGTVQQASRDVFSSLGVIEVNDSRVTDEAESVQLERSQLGHCDLSDGQESLADDDWPRAARPSLQRRSF